MCGKSLVSCGSAGASPSRQSFFNRLLTWKANFLVDSGADISLAPRALCERLGLVWDAGQPMLLNGISERPECAVPARIFEVELLIPDLALALDIPICFAEGNASLILGREGFFDCFRIEFDKANFVTRFTLVEDELVEDELVEDELVEDE